MDIIGKVYKDYFIKDYTLDGKSHFIDNYYLGGCCNLFEDNFILDKTNGAEPLNYFLICNKNLNKKLSYFKKEFNLELINVEFETPTALIFENNYDRTSFVIEDKLLKIKKIREQKSSAALIFYGDKIYSESFFNYEQLFIDTAGNNKNDLDYFLESDYLNENTIISISKEYIDNKSVKKFIENKKSTLILHNPKKTLIINYLGKIEIPNKYYLSILEKKTNDFKITGLGDKFFTLISYYNYHLKLNLKASVIKSQELISKYINQSINIK